MSYLFQGRKRNKETKMKQTKVKFSSEKLNYSCNLMRALAHPLRLKILEFIDNQGTTNVNRIYNTLKIEQSITSQHLKILRLADVVRSEREGKMVSMVLFCFQFLWDCSDPRV